VDSLGIVTRYFSWELRIRITVRSLSITNTKFVHRWVFVGYLMLSARQALCLAISRCYGDVNICLWTDGSAALTQSAAQRACQQRDYSFLPRITNSYIQNKMGEFRTEAYYQLYGRNFWIDVKATDSYYFHWIDDSQFRGLFFCGAYMIIIVSCYWVTCKPAVMNLQAIRTCNAGPVDPVALRSCFYIFGPTL